ncbi:MAG: DUF3109 family protein [Gemmataceae bacterium]|nr:DUF3109 family protein [Gemmataceae bacterium]
MADKRVSLAVINGATATFECIYGRGCDGICCQQGRPPVAPDEAARLDAALPKILPLLTPYQQRAVATLGYASRRLKSGKPMLRVLDGWCIFFNEGCVLHKLGAAEGDKFKYKPAPCSLFPLERDDASGDYYVRQHGYKGEQWGELFCLAPDQTDRLAVETLAEEMAFAEKRANHPA